MKHLLFLRPLALALVAGSRGEHLAHGMLRSSGEPAGGSAKTSADDGVFEHDEHDVGEVGCLEQKLRPSVVVGGESEISVTVDKLDDIGPQLTGGVSNDGMLQHGASCGNGQRKRGCVREVPKILHLIWVGTPLRTTHAHNIVSIGTKNAEWALYLWVDHQIEEEASEILLDLGRRAAGPVNVKKIPELMETFRNHDLIQKQLDAFKSQNITSGLAGASDYMRMEVLFQYGGIYLDTDAHALQSFDDFGTLFRWPFVTYVFGYNNICNGIFGADKGSHFLDFALDATRENCLKYNTCGVMSGAGPGFLTGAYLAYHDPDIVLIDQKFLVTPRSEQSIIYQDMEANWLKHE